MYDMAVYQPQSLIPVAQVSPATGQGKLWALLPNWSGRTRSNSEAMLCLDNATGKAGTGSSIAPADQTADFHLRSPAASPQRFA